MLFIIIIDTNHKSLGPTSYPFFDYDSTKFKANGLIKQSFKMGFYCPIALLVFSFENVEGADKH